MNVVTEVKIPNRVQEVIKKVEAAGATVTADNVYLPEEFSDESHKVHVVLSTGDLRVLVSCYYSGATKRWSTWSIATYANGQTRELALSEVAPLVRNEAVLARLLGGLN